MLEVYTVADLRKWNPAEEKPPVRLAVFGDPVAHSASPQLHNAGLRACGIDCQYVRIHVRPEELAEALELIKKHRFIGVNLTIPHKTEALKLVQRVDEAAARLGAINTVLVEGDTLAGFNTDGPGIVRAIRVEFSVDLRDLRIMILGAGGGAGRAIATQCALEQCERLVLVNRTQEKAAQLVHELRPLLKQDRALPVDRLVSLPWNESQIAKEISQTDLIINTSSVGMKRSDPSPLPGWVLQPHLMVYDTTYTQNKTSLLAEAEEAGARGANGLSLLLYQGVFAFEIWFDRDAPVEVMRTALIEAKRQP